MQNPLEKVKEIGAIRQGHFQLASGKHSAHYVQVAQLTQYPYILDELLQDKLPDLQALDIDTVFSPAIGALPVGQQIGLALKARTLFAERNKDHIMELRRGFTLEQNEKLLLIEDVMTTGGTLKELKKIALDQGAEIRGVFTVVNRSGQNTWEGIPIHSLVDLVFPTYTLEECLLCKQNIPLDKPGTKASNANWGAQN